MAVLGNSTGTVALGAAVTPDVSITTDLDIVGTISAGSGLGVTAVTDADWTSVSFSNSWANFGLGFETAQYYKDVLGFVRIRGLIKSGSVGSAAFTLPVGYRPALNIIVATVSASLFGELRIYGAGHGQAGQVVPTSPTTNTWVSLDIPAWIGN